jgi:hypothetical protein
MFAPNFISNDSVPLKNAPITYPENEATKNGWNFWVTSFPDPTRILEKITFGIQYCLFATPECSRIRMARSHSLGSSRTIALRSVAFEASWSASWLPLTVKILSVCLEINALAVLVRHGIAPAVNTAQSGRNRTQRRFA